ncbi:la-related protein 1B isoform X2 [Ranitomeya imitator]|uniref:la-related protein 1B isoform X2 n=1 Tax=Ranitomeya imitator TaxID=111125 RepID=UPI0037E78713
MKEKDYEEFRHLAVEEARENYRYGLECLFRFYSYGLEKKFRPDIFKDFQDETLKDYETGQLYGFKKFWAFLKYAQVKNMSVNPMLQNHLSKFKRLEDFRIDPPIAEESGLRRCPSNSGHEETSHRRHRVGLQEKVLSQSTQLLCILRVLQITATKQMFNSWGEVVNEENKSRKINFAHCPIRRRKKNPRIF